MRTRNLEQPKGMLKIVEVNREHADDPGEVVRIKFVIGGAPRVKKNTQRSVGYGKATRRINSAAYTKWESFAAPQLEDVKRQFRRMTGRPFPTVDFTFNFRAQFFMDTSGQVDLSALYEGIQDLMVKHGMLLDDNSQLLLSHDGSGVSVDRAHPRTVIEITRKAPEPWQKFD